MGAAAEESKEAVRLTAVGLQQLIDRLRDAGYRVVGPRVMDGAVVYSDVENIDQLPLGWLDEQEGGRYRLHRDESAGYFDHVSGPQSLKNFVFPPRETLLNAARDDNGHWQMNLPELSQQQVAVIGVRSCDLHALRVLDRTLLAGPYVDPAYKSRREGLFLVAVNCRRAAATCFCHSTGTGPVVNGGFDLALHEVEGGFVVEVGTEQGGELLDNVTHTECLPKELAAARQQPVQLQRQMHERSAAGEGRSLDMTDVYQVLMNNLEHPRWDDVAERCLACSNCTMVCPTCFCVSVEEVTDLAGENVQRDRLWDSCFTAEHSYMTSGSVRKSIRARYRQWLTHKLATWQDQFDTSGCVGCGRCITWCPVGIDLTEEVAAIRGDSS